MNPRTLPLVALGLILGSLSVGAADWLGFRGPGGLGIAKEKDLPTTWDDDKHVVWKAKLPGPGGSSPITLGDLVFVTCYSGYGVDKGGEPADLRRHLVCLERRGGEIKWDKEVPAATPETRFGGFVALHGYASSTPTTDGERVYVFHGKSGVFAYDLKGKELWKASVGDGINGWGSGSSPVLYKDLLIVNASIESENLVALNKTTGAQVWKTGIGGWTWASPILVDVKDGKQEVVMNVRGKIIGLDPASGKELWHCEGINDYICPSVTAKDGVVYAIGGRQATALAVKAGGAGDVTESHRLWRVKMGANVTSPVVVGDHLYWVSDSATAYCLKLATGEKEYAERLQGSGNIYASAVAADGKLFVVSRDSGVFVLAAQPKFEMLAHNTFKGDKSTFNGSPAVSNGQLLLRSNQYLYCIGKK